VKAELMAVAQKAPFFDFLESKESVHIDIIFFAFMPVSTVVMQ